MKHGINRLLYERRKELHFSRREASIKIDCYRWELYLIEHGYISVPERYKENIIYKYDLPDTFFDDDSRYPLELDETPKKKKEKSGLSKFISKLFNSKVFKISSIGLTLGFMAMAISGVCMSSNALSNPLSFFDEKVTDVSTITKTYGHINSDPHDSEFVLLMLDKYYAYEYNPTASKQVSINFFDKDQNIASSFYKAKFNTLYLEENYESYIECRVLHDCFRARMTLYQEEEKFGYVTADVNQEGKVSFVEIKGYNSEGQYVVLEEGTINYIKLSAIFDINYPIFINMLRDFFVNDSYLSAVTTFDDYFNTYVSNVGSYNGYKICGGCFIIFGAALALLLLALGLVAIFGKNRIYDKLQPEEIPLDEMAIISQRNEQSKELKPIKKNWKFFPPIPESLARIIAILLLYSASICLYYIFTSVLSLDIGQALKETGLAIVLSNFTIIGTICIFFLKLDIYSNKKTMFLINYVEFFLGLGYYFLLIIIKYILCCSQTSISNIGTALLNYVPGNTLWGCVAFNLLIMFLFMRPKNIAHDAKKMKHYRLLAILPLAYLIASSVLSIGKENFGWNIPFELYSLFFAKSFITVVFALLFVFGAFIYKEKVYKKYGKENAEIYIRGNKYYFTKNLIACGAILILGLFEVIFYLAWPDNPYGFGDNKWILLAIPLILLYHPHHDKRNGLFDTVMCILYYISLCIGIVLIVIVCLQYLLNI